MSNKSSHASRRSSRGAPAPKGPPMDFWEAKTLEQLAAEQGVHAIERLEEVLGKGADLWRDDAELDSFLAALREQRRKGA
jgi:hypothetical protein